VDHLYGIDLTSLGPPPLATNPVHSNTAPATTDNILQKIKDEKNSPSTSTEKKEEASNLRGGN
jgi:hypothetical protein